MESQLSILSFKNIALVIIFILWMYWLWSRRQYYAFALRFPGKLGLPIVGILPFIKHLDYILRFFGTCTSGVHKTVCIWLGMYPVLITIEPEVIEKILISPEFLAKAMPIYEPLDFALKGGILTAPDKKWRFHRKNLSILFKHKTLLSFFPIFNNIKNNMVKDFNEFVDQGEHMVYKTIVSNINVLVLETTLNLKVSTESEKKKISSYIDSFFYILRSITMQIASSSVNLQNIFRLYPKYQKEYNSVSDFWENMIEELMRQKDIEANAKYAKTGNEFKDLENNSEKKPIILIDLVYKLYKEQTFSWKDVISECFTLMIASLETTANTIYSTLIFLATHPPVQERLFQEIAAVFGDKDADVQCEQYGQLPYLEMVLQETLRLAPAFPLIGRTITKPFELPNGVIVPKGVQLVISVAHLHRRKDIWGPNADNFDPDHFLPENIASRHPYAFIPFSKGARNCIGYHYAQLVLKVMLIGLVRNFRFETDFEYKDVEIKFNISSAFIKAPNLRIYRRN